MKKLKELLLFIAILVIPIVLFFVISSFATNVISDKPSFIGIENYIRLFLNDKTFGKALLNTILMPVTVSFLLVAVFAVIVFLIRKKIKVPRWIFYLGSVFIGGVTTLFYTSYLSMAFFRMTSNLFTAQTIVSHIIDYRPSVFDAINPLNVLFALYIGVFTTFLFWLGELIYNKIKSKNQGE